MADGGWGHGSPVGTGIYQVLQAYVTQGGQLYAARRWAENPLTLTHVRWQGPSGNIADAFRQPGGDAASSPEEREVWVQLALHFPAAQPTPSGPDAPWLPLQVDPAKVTGWVNLLRVRLGSRGSEAFSPRDPMPASPAGGGMPMSNRPYSGFSPESSGVTPYNAPRMPPVSVPRTPPGPRPAFERQGPPVISRPTAPPALGDVPSPIYDESRQFSRGGLGDVPEVVVLPSVEVELPPEPSALPGSDFRKEFARDVALHFGRAARAIPQVREARGWMRGDRLILAARFVLGMGSRAPTGLEMESTARTLAEALAQRTLPYTRMTFADPGEWMQGAPLPE